MSAEVLTIVFSALGIVLTLGGSSFAGLAWLVRRIDAVEQRLNDKIDAVETRLTEKIDAVDIRLSTRIDALASDMVEVKISLARIEGPARRLVVAGRISG